MKEPTLPSPSQPLVEAHIAEKLPYATKEAQLAAAYYELGKYSDQEIGTPQIQEYLIKNSIHLSGEDIIEAAKKLLAEDLLQSVNRTSLKFSGTETDLMDLLNEGIPDEEGQEVEEDGGEVDDHHADLAGKEVRAIEIDGENRKVETLRRYLSKLKAHLKKLRDDKDFSHNELRKKDGEYRSDDYVTIYSRMNTIKKRLDGLDAGEVINDAEFQQLKDELVDSLKIFKESEKKNDTPGTLDTLKLSKDDLVKKVEPLKLRKDQIVTPVAIKPEGELAGEVIDSSQNGKVEAGDFGRTIIEGSVERVKVLGVNSDGSYTVVRLRDREDENSERFIVEGDNFQIASYEIRRKLRQEWQGKKSELEKMYQTRSYRWVGRWLGKEDEKLKELNQAKADYNKVLKAALLERADKRKGDKVANQYLANMGDEGSQRRLDNLETAYNPIFIKRNIIDDAVWRNEVKKNKLSPERKQIIDKVQKAASYYKKKKWWARLGIVTVVGVGAGAGGVMAGAAILPAMAVGGAAAAVKGGRMMAGVGAAMLAGGSTYNYMSGGVFKSEDALGSLDNRLKTNSLTTKVDAFDEASMEAERAAYQKHLKGVDNAKRNRAIGSATAGVGAGLLVGGFYESITDSLAPAEPPEYLATDPKQPQPPSDEPAPELNMAPDELLDREGDDLLIPPETIKDTRPEEYKLGGQDVPGAISEETEQPISDLGEDDSNIEVSNASDPFVTDRLNNWVANDDSLPMEDTIPEINQELPNPPQMLEVPKGSTPSEAFWSAYKSGELTGLPEGMGRTEFLNKMWEAFHAVDNNEAIVVDRMGMDRADVDFIKAGDSLNVTPLIEHMNGKSIQEIESGLYSVDATLAREGDTPRVTASETSSYPTPRPDTEMSVSTGEDLKTVGAGAEVEMFEPAVEGYDPTPQFAELGLDEDQFAMLHDEFKQRVDAGGNPESLADILVERTKVEQFILESIEDERIEMGYESFGTEFDKLSEVVRQPSYYDTRIGQVVSAIESMSGKPNFEGMTLEAVLEKLIDEGRIKTEGNELKIEVIPGKLAGETVTIK